MSHFFHILCIITCWIYLLDLTEGVGRGLSASEGATLRIPACPTGKVIAIEETYYVGGCGCRCNPAKNPTFLLSMMRAKCEGYTDCTVVIEAGLFGDPCPGISKTLGMVYNCVKPYF